MEIKLAKFIRQKAINDCQHLLKTYSNYDTNFILAKMSDLKLAIIDQETRTRILNQKQEEENETTSQKTESRSP